MKLKRLAKRIMTAGFAVFMTSVCLSDGMIVKAGVDDYPPEVKFPISILDFRADNLLFEWPSGDSTLGLASYKVDSSYAAGKGLVEKELDEDGYPVYKDKVLRYIAERTQAGLKANSGDILSWKEITSGGGILNPLRASNIIRMNYTRDVLTSVYAKRYMNGNGTVIPESYIQWKIDDGADHTYKIGFDSRYGQNGKWPVVFESTATGDVALYSIEYNGIVMIADSVRVSKTVSGLSNKTHTIAYSKASNMKVYANGTDVASGTGITPSGGKIKISIEKSGAPTAGTLAAAGKSDYTVEAESCSPAGSAGLATGAAFSPGTGNTNVRWDGSGTLTHQFMCGADGNYEMKLYYAAAVACQYSLDINGETQVVDCESTGDWYTLSPVPKSITIPLKQGMNTIIFSDVGGQAPTLDRFEIVKNGTQIGSTLASDSGWYHFEAEDYLTGGQVDESMFCSGGKYVSYLGPTKAGKCTFKLDSDVDGIRKIRLYYMTMSNRNFKVVVNGGTPQTVKCSMTNPACWNKPVRVPKEIQASMKKGENTIEVYYFDSTDAPNLDYIEVESELSTDKVEDLTLSSDEDNYPVGDLEESKDKYKNNPELGWFDMSTCMDYAYFVTSHFWRYHSSLNTMVPEYDTILFNRREYGGNPAYQFSAHQNDGHANIPLCKNPVDKSFRNPTDLHPFNEGEGDQWMPSGFMFVCEDVPHKLYYGKDVDKTRGSDHKIGGVQQKKNFHFSISSHSQFVFNKKISQYFYFSGDDDVYIFVNNHLVFDLGSAHAELSDKIDLLKLYQKQDFNPDGSVNRFSDKYMGLEDGKVVNLDMFYLERHSTGSNFYALMNITLAPDMISDNVPYDTIPYGYKVDLNYKFTSQRQMTTNKNFKLWDDFGNKIGADGLTLADGVSLKDNTLKCIVTKQVKNAEGKFVDVEDETRSKTFTFADPKNLTPTELSALTTYFHDLALSLNDTLTLNGLQYDTGTKPYDSYTAGYPEDPDKRDIVFNTYASYDQYLDGADEITPGKATQSHNVGLLLGRIKIVTDAKDNHKKQLASYGAFTLTRDTETAARYVNDPTKTKYTKEKVFEGKDALPEGSYTLKLDTTVLHNYDVYIYKGPDYEITDDDVPAAKLDPANQMTLDFEATYNEKTKSWMFWDYYFVLRAKRDLLELKDLT